jgi:septal ring factor EnvC (AmiA/AmiB activator)
MTRTRRTAGVLIVTLLGLWGCSKAPTDSTSAASAEKIKAVETKLSRLEDDFRAAASARDQLQKKLATTVEAHQAQLDRLTRDLKEKEELLAKRTAERDTLDTQYATFRKDLKDLIAKAEGPTKSEGSPAVPLIPTSNKKPDAPELPAIPDVPAPPK